MVWSPKAGANERGKTWLAGLSLVAVSGGALGDLGEAVEDPDSTIALHYLVEIRLKL